MVIIMKKRLKLIALLLTLAVLLTIAPVTAQDIPELDVPEPSTFRRYQRGDVDENDTIAVRDAVMIFMNLAKMKNGQTAAEYNSCCKNFPVEELADFYLDWKDHVCDGVGTQECERRHCPDDCNDGSGFCPNKAECDECDSNRISLVHAKGRITALEEQIEYFLQLITTFDPDKEIAKLFAKIENLEMQKAELIVAPSIPTEGKAEQKSQGVGMGR